MIAIELTSEQRAIVAADCVGPRLVDAGAGTGKTFTMVERVRALVEAGFAPDSLLLVTFTNAAALELATRLEGTLPPHETRRPTCSTFHGLASAILREFAYDVGATPDLSVIDDGRARGIFARAFRDLEAGRLDVDLGAFPLVDRPRAMERSLAKIAVDLKSAGTSIDRFRSTALAQADMLERLSYGAIKQLGKPKKDGSRPILKDTNKPDPERTIEERRHEAANERMNVLVVSALFQRFQDLLDEAGLLTFGDVIVRATALVNDHPNIATTLRHRWCHAIVDEFQDTNGTQIAFLEAIFGASLEPVLVVGDVRQAIYEFNGADSQGIVRFRERAVESLPLGENRRSFQPILDLAHHALEHLSGGRYAASGAGLRAHRGGNDPKIVRVRAFAGPDAREREAAAVANDVARLIEREGCAPGDIALLMRGRMRAHLYAEALNARGIATQLRGGTGFFDAPEIREVVAWSRMAIDPTDRFALVAAAQGGAFALSDGALGHLASEKDFAKAMLFDPIPERIDSVTKARLERFRETARYVSALGTLPLAESSRAIVAASGAELAGAAESETAAQARANLDQFVRLASDLSRDLPQATLRELVAELDEREALELDLPIAELAGDRVSLVTVHGAKGLEWNHVFVVDVAPSAFPIVTNDMRQVVACLSDDGALALKAGVDGRPTLRWYCAQANPDSDGVVVKSEVDYEEEHRLFYVALTRARDGVTITGRTDRYGNASKCVKAVQDWLRVSAFDETDHTLGDPPDTLASAAAAVNSTIGPEQLQLLFHRSDRRAEANAAPKRLGTLSYTAMELQERCPRRARYHYLNGLPELEDIEPIVGMSAIGTVKRDPAKFGRIVHKVLEYDAKARLERSERNVEQFIDDAIEEEGGAITEAQAVRLAVNAARVVLDEYEIVAAEHQFSMTIDGVALGGYIDLLALDRDKRLVVVDYKTGHTPGEHYALQFALYARAARESFGEEPLAMLLRIGDGTATPETVQIATQEVLRAAVAAANTMESDEPRPSSACKYCPYAYDVCDAAPIATAEK